MGQTHNKLFLSLLLIILPFISIAQDYPNSFSLALGYPLLAMKSDIKDCPMIVFQYERRVQRFGVAVLVSYGEFTAYDEEHFLNVYTTAKTTGEVFVSGLRGNYYLLDKERLDLYGGIMLGVLSASNGVFLESRYSNSKYKTGTSGYMLASEANGFKLGFQAGGHYWFRQRFGLWGELSYGTTLLKAGIVLRR